MGADERAFPRDEVDAAEPWSDVYARLAVAEEELRAGRARDARVALQELRERMKNEVAQNG